MAQGPAGAAGLWRAEAHRCHGLGPGETRPTACSEAQPSQRLGVPRRELPLTTSQQSGPSTCFFLVRHVASGCCPLGGSWGDRNGGLAQAAQCHPRLGAQPSPAQPCLCSGRQERGPRPQSLRVHCPVQLSQCLRGRQGSRLRGVRPDPKGSMSPRCPHLSWAQSLSLLPGTLGLAQHNAGAPAVAPGQPPGHLAGRY